MSLKLSNEFLDKYKNIEPPMTALGNFVYYRTYSRFLPELNRREYWWETCRRAVEYNCNLVKNVPQKEAEELFDAMFNLKMFLSGRTLWVGGTESSKKYPSSNFNCSYTNIEKIDDICEVFYLLMLGCGVGFSALKEQCDKLPEFKTNIILTNLDYIHNGNQEKTKCISGLPTVNISVGDSKEGWVDALYFLLNSMTYKTTKNIIINYNNVRPEGTPLKTFGGYASGPEPLKQMFDKIVKVIKNSSGKLQPVDVLDICNLLGQAVQVGGVRRSAEVCLFDKDDKNTRYAKQKIFSQDKNGNWITNVDILHRTSSNNSILFNSKPSYDELKEIFESIKTTGEPGFINAEEARRRFTAMKGMNPCCEILLPSKGFCNLVEVNCTSGNDAEDLTYIVELATRASYRMACVDIELPEWDKNMKENMLLGVSLSGWQDFINRDNFSEVNQKNLLNFLRNVSHDVMKKYAKELGRNESKLVTTEKPSGCWTKDHIRTTDSGILFIDEINDNIDSKIGFTDIADKSLHIQKNLVTKTFNKGKSDLLRVTLQNNRKLDITKEHPIYIEGKGWTKATDLKIGDKVETCLGAYSNDKNVQLQGINLSAHRSDIRDYKLPVEMSEPLAYLIGAYYANGCMTTLDRIKYSCNNLEANKKVQKIWATLFNVSTTIGRASQGRDCYAQDFRSTKIIEWLKVNGLYKEKDFSRIPEAIRKSSRDCVLAFIVGYADNDGCFYNGKFCIDSCNESFMRHLQEVGEAVGISFGFSINKARDNSYSGKPMYKIALARAFTEKSAIDKINAMSAKAKVSPITVGTRHSKNPYIVKAINPIEEANAYDIEVDNSHEYYQGGLRSHNTLSLLPTVSPGIHYSHSPYYIRRVRINSGDPLVKVCEELGYKIVPEVGQTEENCTTKVIEFYVKSPEGKTKQNVTAIEQLENYKMFMQNYVDHNASVTVTVKNDEWESVVDWVYKNWDDFVGISFLSLDDSVYQLMPYEAISEEQYNELVTKYPTKVITPEMIAKYETTGESDIGDSECSGGVCPIR